MKPSTMPSFTPATTLLLVVDPQLAFGQAIPVPGVDAAVQCMRNASAAWRQVGGRVWITRHAFNDGAEPGRLEDFIPHIRDVLDVNSPLSKLYPKIQEPNDRVLIKTRFNAAVGTSLFEDLETAGIDTVVVAGLTTPICVQATVDGLSMHDFRVVVLRDACASQPIAALTGEEAHTAAVARMGYVFARIASTSDFVANLSAPAM